ncbi:CoA transferase, partial [Modestobacter marinus]|uniref:CoA transferase n=1 Tax=Modestobacter marinus TaxID=477641 RepID=UPI0016638AA7
FGRRAAETDRSKDRHRAAARPHIAAGVPCGPINTVDQGVAFAESIGLDPVVTVGEGTAAVPSVRHPITFSETPADYRLPPPALDEHGAELRRWLATEEDA